MDIPLKKILKSIIKIFLEKETVRYDNCLYCGNVLTGSRRKFCSDDCNDVYWRAVYSGKVRRDEPAYDTEILLKGGKIKNAKKD